MIALVVGIVFNIIQVFSLEKACKIQRDTTELQIFIQAHQMVNNSIMYFNEYHGDEISVYLEGRGGDISVRAWDNMLKLLKDVEHFTWLFNTGYLSLERAKNLWDKEMRDLIFKCFSVMKKNLVPRLLRIL